jgi:ADP-heptose:LPS heptosyltransferase
VKVDIEVPTCHAHASALSRATDSSARESLLIEPDLLQVARRMASADLYVGNDAGTTHLAAALGTPTIAIFGPSDPQVWQPLGTHVAVVASPQPGTSITMVSVESVLKAVNRSLLPAATR